jgi:hypothetical protein
LAQAGIDNGDDGDDDECGRLDMGFLAFHSD